MERSLKLFFAVSLLLVPILTNFVLASNTLAASSVTHTSGTIYYSNIPGGWLHRDGIYIKDAQNRTIAMRGIHCGYATFNGRATITQAVIDMAKAHGATYLEVGWTRGSASPLDFAIMDTTVSRCQANNMYLVINLLEGSGGYSSTDVIPISTWAQIIQRYANSPTVMGVKLIDEPNYPNAEERAMWTNAINTLKQYNPKLLWFTHVINRVRLNRTYDALVWRTISDLPITDPDTGRSNVLIDGGAWVRLPTEQIVIDDPTTSEPAGGLPLNASNSDVDGHVDSLIADLIAYRNKVPMPVGLAYGSNNIFWSMNAHVYFLQHSMKDLEDNGLYYQLYFTEYMWQGFYEPTSVTLDRLLPYAPYSYYRQ